MQQTLAASIRRSSLVTLVGMAGLALSLGGMGCDDRSDNVRSIEKASQDLVSMTGGGTYAAPADARKKGLDAAASAVQDAASDGSDGEKAPAAVLTASTQDGLALAPAEEALRLDRDSRNTITRINSILSEWGIRNATATAAASFDPSAQITELRASKSARAERISIEQARLAELETRLAALLANAATKMKAADDAQASYVQQMTGVAKLSAVAAAPVVEQANKARREGDIARLAGSRIEAEAAEVAPLISELKLVIAQLENQNKNLDATEAELNGRATAYRAEASESTTAATVAANDIDSMVGSLKELHAGPLSKAFEDAESLLSKAAANASKGGTASPVSGKLAVANAQSTLADLQWSRAMSAASLATTLELLAGAQPALPQSASYASDAAAAREQQKNSLLAATAAFESAKSAVGGARVQGVAKERLERLGELLEKSRSVTSGEAADVNATFNLKVRKSPVAAREATAEQAPEAAPVADAGTPIDPDLIAMVDAMDAASKAGEDVSSYMISTNPDSIVAMTGPDRLRAAAKKAYGKDLKELLEGSPLASLADQSGMSSTDLKITMKDADNATSTLPGAPIPLAFKRVDGNWKFNLDGMGPMAKMMLFPIGKALGNFAAEVEAGNIPEADFNAKLMQTMQGAMSGGGMPPGDK